MSKENPLKGIFANVNDDMLLRDCGNLYAENKELKEEKENLIKCLEKQIKECENTLEMLEDTNSHRISILKVEISNYQNILERLKSGKYE